MSPYVEDVVQQVVARVVFALREDSNDEALHKVATLLAICKMNGCEVQWRIGCRSFYKPLVQDDGTPGGVIYVDELASTVEMARQLAHELTHHYLYWHGTRMVSAYEGEVLDFCGADRRVIEERICQTVEDKIATLPVGILRNGRMALPATTRVVARVYQRRPAPRHMSYAGDLDES
jgi:hypothetical protein